MVVLSDHEPLKTYRNKRNDDSNSENINNQNKTLEKKAIKKWFKARLIFNEKIHS